MWVPSKKFSHILSPTYPQSRGGDLELVVELKSGGSLNGVSINKA